MSARKRVDESGTSLPELMAAVGVFGIVAAGLVSVLGLQGSYLASTLGNASDNIDIEVATRELNSIFAGMNVKVFGFMGDGSGQTAVVRIPMRDTCANINQACTGSTAFVFASSRKKALALPAICVLNQSDRISMILDITDVGAQTYRINGTGVELRQSGTVVSRTNLPVGGFVNMMAEQYGLLLRVSSAPVLYDPRWNAAGIAMEPAFAENPDCSLSASPTSRLAKVEVQSFLLPRTGGLAPDRSTIVRELGKFPVRIGEGIVMSVGKDANGNTAALNECVASGAAANPLSCHLRRIALSNIERIDFHGFLKVPFMESAALMSFGLMDWSCAAALGCVTMNFSTPIPYILATESLTRFSNESFSLIKQEHLSSLLIRLGTIRKTEGGKTIRGKKTIYVNLI